MTDAFGIERSRINNDLRTLQNNITEQSLLGDVTSLATQIQNLPTQIQDIRQRGYKYAGDLEQAVATFIKQWPDVEADARYRAQRRSQRIGWDIQDLQETINRLNNLDAASAQTWTTRLNGELSRIRDEITEAHRQISQAGGTIPDQVKAIADRLSTIQEYMKHVSEASFPFNSGEAVYMAVEAKWQKGNDKKDNPEGVFYVTNQRLIMEQNEKKGGFAGIGGNKVQGLAFETPLTGLQAVSSENKGFLGNVDLVHLRFGSGGPAAETVIEVKHVKADWFASQLQRAMRGDFEKERVAS